jgi:hypothetical protein
MNKLYFYDIVNKNTLKIGDKMGKYKLALIINIDNSDIEKKFTATYNGYYDMLLNNKSIYNLKERIRELDYREHLIRKEYIINKAMKYELNEYLNNPYVHLKK